MPSIRIGYIAALLGGALAVMASCERVIDLDLRSSRPVAVVEANLFADSLCRVRVTRSVDFGGPDLFPPVADAVVVLRDSVGLCDTLAQCEPGVYLSQTIRGVEGVRYDLSVECGGELYLAASTMPRRVPLDSMRVTEMKMFGETFLQLVPHYTDPGQTDNFYMFEVAVNGVSDHRIHAWGNTYTMGQVNQTPINLHKAQKGDRLSVAMLCIDHGAYLFYHTLDSNGGISPANPATNFSGGCLGYFKACTIQTMEATVE
ncbi:hypothetical protein FACS1894159_10430 [Bacteroidia bacterium]|nr:hypothetical protein FACS1894159_10430 [Bacteroidia bacterium]